MLLDLSSISMPVGNSLNVRVRALLIWHRKAYNKKKHSSTCTLAARQTFKEFPTGVEIQRLTAALRDLYGIQEPKKEPSHQI